MQEHFMISTDGPGSPFKIEVNKIWIENDEVFFTIVDWNKTIGLPNNIFEHVRENIYRWNTRSMYVTIVHERGKKIADDAQDLKEVLKETYEESTGVEKLVSDINNNISQVKISIDKLIETGTKKLKQKGLRSFNFFTGHVKEELDKIKIPTVISDWNLKTLSETITKFFTTLNFIGRKTLPDFNKELLSEVADLNFLTYDLQKKHEVLKKKI